LELTLLPSLRTEIAIGSTSFRPEPQRSR